MFPVNFTINLSNIGININCNFGSSKEYCGDYLSSRPPDIFLNITKEDIAFEKAKSQDEYSTHYLEVQAIYRKIADVLIEHDIILMHGSAVRINGVCHMLTGPSGSGKSTHAALLKQYNPENVTIINDDKPLIKISNNKCEVFGTPWSGSHQISENTSAPLKNICFIKQASINEIIEISKDAALPLLMQQIFKSEDSEKVSKTLDLINKLMQNVNFYEIKCTKDISAAELSYKTLDK